MINKINFNDIDGIRLELLKSRVCIIKGFKIDSHIKFIDYLGQIGNIYAKNNGSTISTIQHKRTNSKNKHGYTRKFHFPHIDQSHIENQPKYVVLGCKKQSSIGGQSFIVDNKEIKKEVKKNNHLYKVLSNKNNFEFSDCGHSKYNGSILSNQYNDFTIRYKNDCIKYNIKYKVSIEKFKKIVMNKAKFYKLRKNEILIVNNETMLHGRNFFKGNRSIYRVLLSSLL